MFLVQIQESLVEVRMPGMLVGENTRMSLVSC